MGPVVETRDRTNGKFYKDLSYLELREEVRKEEAYSLGGLLTRGPLNLNIPDLQKQTCKKEHMELQTSTYAGSL